MNEQSKVATVDGANSRRAELLHELKQGSGMARRQKILKTLWRLDRQSTMLAASTVDRARVPAKATPQAQRPTAPVPYERRCAPEKQDSPTQASDIVSRYGAAVPSLLSDEQPLQILNQLYATLKYSLACYLRYARPWGKPTEERLREVIRWIGDEQRAHVDRIGSFIIERRGRVEHGSFPLRFSAFNDLSLAYLAPLVLKELERNLHELKPLVCQLESDSAAYDLAMEILGFEQAQCDNLREMIDGQVNNYCHRSSAAKLSEQCSQKSSTTEATAA